MGKARAGSAMPSRGQHAGALLSPARGKEPGCHPQAPTDDASVDVEVARGVGNVSFQFGLRFNLLQIEVTQKRAATPADRAQALPQ
eukprot:4167952-Alexandrium_andersonii.AAC.1